MLASAWLRDRPVFHLFGCDIVGSVHKDLFSGQGGRLATAGQDPPLIFTTLLL
jgi:hypothetical protein